MSCVRMRGTCGVAHTRLSLARASCEHTTGVLLLLEGRTQGGGLDFDC